MHFVQSWNILFYFLSLSLSRCATNCIQKCRGFLRWAHVFICHIKVDVHAKNIAFFIASYDFSSFHKILFLRSMMSKIWVCWENDNLRSEKWRNGNPNYANRKGFQKVTFGYFTYRIQSTCDMRLRFSKFALDLLKSP